jgi:2-methylcitrate dehydratase PrpD
MDAAYLFAENFSRTNYDDIPQEEVEATKKLTLDSLGVTLAGSSKPGVQELMELISGWGGSEESTILCSGRKVPAPHAAQINATMGHALDFDDTHDNAVIHSAVITVPTCLAMAEYIGKLSGKDFITAATLGIDMICRMGLASKPDTRAIKLGWHLTSLYGYITAAGIAGRILGLDKDGIVNAFGIAYHQNAGNGQGVADGALTKRMGPGFATRAGIVSALMAEKGITGAKNSLEGEFGLFNLYHVGNYDGEALTANLGKKYEGTNVSVKPYPCCRCIHGFIDSTLEIVTDNNIAAQDVSEIVVTCGEGAYNIVGSPIEIKRNPQVIVDAQFSIPWAVATATVNRKVTIEHFTEEAIHNGDILEISNKVKLEPDSSFGHTSMIAPAIVKIVTRDGKAYTNQVEHTLGSPQRPLTFDQCAEKFKDCASYSIKKLPTGNINRVIEMIRQLESVEDVREIIALLA